MNNSVPVEYLSSFTQANQSLMLHLATELLGEGGRIGDFQRFAELAQVQQDYVQQMGALWLNIMMQSATESIQPGKGDRRFASEDWQKSPFHDFLKRSYLINARYVNGLDKVNALGFCVGGTMLGCAAAILAARGERKIQSLTFLTTMLDFTESGEIGLLIDEASVASREQTIGKTGIMPGHELAFVFSTLRGNDLIWPYVVGNYLEGRQPDAFDILYWNADSTNLPGPMYCWYVRNTYLENNLRIPIKTTQCGTAVDLMQIDAPMYVLACREDHIVPWQTAYRTARLVSSEVRFTLAASGHIAGVINPATRNKRSFWIDGKLGIEPEYWLEIAREVPGSWWTDWSAWLAMQAGNLVPARSQLGTAQFPEVEPAPGRYVRVRSD
jgi:poly[(R)-3-hydroxyalkanoate] polymerase subunit PhaC